ncbi:hypothetical protein [Aliarcobacter cryaerophilus]|nr:hypothetical protein [Aliarcobacter cryaerophilus]
MIGINDIAGYKTVDEIYNNYVKILEDLERKDIKVYPLNAKNLFF